MRRLALAFPHLTGIDRLPEDIAWRLVESVFQQRAALVVGVLCCVALGLAGYIGTGSGWYLVGVGYTVVIGSWRLAQSHAFHRNRQSATPTEWALRSLVTATATAIGWGFWTLIVPFEPDKGLVAAVMGIHAGLISGGAVRNSGIRVISTAQTTAASIPLLFSCLASDNLYLKCYVIIVAIHFLAALSLAKFLHERTIRLLVSERDARELAAKLASVNEELALVNEHLEQQVGLDSLTELPNRRAFDLAAAREWRGAARDESPLAVMMIDIDHFKLFNDHYGHQAGDDCLRHVAAAMATTLRRPGDFLARYGGEEFIAILPQTDAEGALQIAERMLAALADRAMAHTPSALGRISVSIGLACAVTVQGHSLRDFIASADEALYQAKRGGRNRVHLHAPHTVPSLTDA